MTIRHFPDVPQPRKRGWPIMEMSHSGHACHFAHIENTFEDEAWGNEYIGSKNNQLENVCNLYNYADDDTLFNTHHSITCLKTKLETSAAVAMHWFDVNGVKSNQVKFQAMILNNHPDLSDISLCVNDMNIPLKSCVKLLGVFIDYELNFSDHVRYLSKRAVKRCSQSGKYLKKDCLLKIF